MNSWLRQFAAQEELSDVEWKLHGYFMVKNPRVKQLKEEGEL